MFAGVAPGLVDGVIAPTTPTGRAISVIPEAKFSAITPTDFAPCKSRINPSVLRWFLCILSSTLPSPVSRTASSASARLRDGSMIAHAAAAQSRSVCFWLKVSATACAVRARLIRLAIVATSLIRRAFVHQLSSFAPEALATLAQRSISLRTNLPNSAGGIPPGSAAAFAQPSLMLGSSSALTVSR